VSSKKNNRFNKKSEEVEQMEPVEMVEEMIQEEPVVIEKPKPVPAKKEALKSGAVKMKFSEHKYYNDLNKPMFMAGEVYVLEGVEWISRWLKRGGEIVQGDLVMPEHVVNKSQLVANESEKTETNENI
jgi:hypothetical protein